MNSLMLKKKDKAKMANTFNNMLMNVIGTCYFAKKDYKNAVKYFNKATKTSKDLSTPIINYATDLIENFPKDKEGYLAQYKCLMKLLKDDPSNINIRLRFALLNMELGNYEDAIKEYKFILKLNPKTFYAMFNLTCLYMMSKDYTSLGRLYLEIGNILKEDINIDEPYEEGNSNAIINKCLKYYVEAQKLLSDNLDVILALADLYRMIDKHKEALSYIDLALKIDRRNYRVYYEGFLIYDEIGDQHTAKEMIKICLMLNIGFIKGYNALGNILRREKLYDEALKVFETALVRECDNIILLNNYANTLLEMVSE